MTPTEQLKKIEALHHDEIHFNQDIDWLINRVKRLTAALESLIPETRFKADCACFTVAHKALEQDDGP